MILSNWPLDHLNARRWGFSMLLYLTALKWFMLMKRIDKEIDSPNELELSGSDKSDKDGTFWMEQGTLWIPRPVSDEWWWPGRLYGVGLEGLTKSSSILSSLMTTRWVREALDDGDILQGSLNWNRVTCFKKHRKGKIWN